MFLDALVQELLVRGSAGATWQLAAAAGTLRRRLQLGDEPAQDGEDILPGGSGGSDSLLQDGEPGAAGLVPAAYSDAGVAAVSTGGKIDGKEEGGEQRMAGTAPDQVPDGAAAELQASSGRTSLEQALLAVQEQLACVEEQVRGVAAPSVYLSVVQSSRPELISLPAWSCMIRRACNCLTVHFDSLPDFSMSGAGPCMGGSVACCRGTRAGSAAGERPPAGSQPGNMRQRALGGRPGARPAHAELGAHAARVRRWRACRGQRRRTWQCT